VPVQSKYFFIPVLVHAGSFDEEVEDRGDNEDHCDEDGGIDRDIDV